MTLQHTRQRKETRHRQDRQSFDRAAIHSIATQTVSRSPHAKPQSRFQSNLTSLPVLQLKCNCEKKDACNCEEESSMESKDDKWLIQRKGKTLKQINAQARREKKEAQKGTPGQGIGHDLAETGAQLTCYKNAGCGGERRTYASAHNCCTKFGKSFRYGNERCTSCTHQTTVTAKH